MNNSKCCVTEDDRALWALIAYSTGAFNFPGKIGVNDNILSVKFPLGENDAVQDGESFISSLRDLQLWKILNTGSVAIDSELTKKIALNLGVPVEGFNANEKYPDGVKKQSSADDYGFPFKVPRDWLEPGKTGETIVYNLKQLQFVIGNLIAQNNRVLRPNELLNEGFEYPNAWVASRGKKTSKAFNYLELFELATKMLDHLGIHPLQATLADLNPAKPGEQAWGIKTYNATHAIKLILEYIKETDGDQAAGLNLNIRMAVLIGEMYVMMNSMVESQQSLYQALGFDIKEDTDYIENFPLDFTLGAGGKQTTGVSFGSNSQEASAKQLEKEIKKILNDLKNNDEQGAETVLEKFMQPRRQPFIFLRLEAAQTLLEVLRNVKSQ
ncbi:hypothetical protein [Okeania sp. KiyG1]|uniref:hypothetical protein n=1 Tax=Okeania sp. KiyG1 TaxID=2720165 RepID=UPI001924859A|nr:hypothetical protein [Okeania sp. KiyG1]GGA53290.1 hypothetical protein CYANOKiyG1_73360 [Okeania sp. KiyG1]